MKISSKCTPILPHDEKTRLNEDLLCNKCAIVSMSPIILLLQELS